jgi:hypothetical protein
MAILQVRKGDDGLYARMTDTKGLTGKERELLLEFVNVGRDKESQEDMSPSQLADQLTRSARRLVPPVIHIDDWEAFFGYRRAAHKLATEVLESWAAKCAIESKTEALLTRHLKRHRLVVMETIEGGECLMWGRHTFPSFEVYVARLLWQLLEGEIAKLKEQSSAKPRSSIKRCRLSECDRFFWAPIRSGPPQTFCSDKHRSRGSMRIARGGKP